jgi:hypothetical protein
MVKPMPNPFARKVPSLRSIPLGIAAGCAAALALPDVSHAAEPAGVGDITMLRAQGPTGLANLLSHFDRLPVGQERDALVQVIDRVAAQRYATVSRLYWYTDLEQAEAAARATQRPILALRMLGRLDEDLSCANSRLFRTVLYANADVSKLMRDHFVLYWSSERPVPKVTIDMGDGRVIHRTTTGNSAHYVLDANGNVLDVLPGLYAPKLFKEELVKSLQLANTVKNADAKKRNQVILGFHAKGLAERQQQFGGVTSGGFTRGGDRSFVSLLARAQRATMSKRVMEVPDLAQFGMDAGTIDRGDIEQWATIGVRMWRLGVESGQARGMRMEQPDAAPRRQAFDTFDAHSIHLMVWLHDVGQPASSEAQIAAMTQRLEYSVIADSAIAELSLRQQIRARLVAQPGIAFDELNAWIYAEVFHTPKSDPWLGLHPRTDFTGLPGDGVASR